MKLYRIGIGGIAIESSSFSPLPSSLDDFTILRGEEMLARYPFMPGWSFRDRTDITWLPCLQAKAIPGGPVARHAYDQMKRELLDRLRVALPLDGFYLDIHGAMNVLGMDDGNCLRHCGDGQFCGRSDPAPHRPKCQSTQRESACSLNDSSH